MNIQSQLNTEFVVAGKQVRTSLALETDQDTARIPKLRQEFFEQGAGTQIALPRKNSLVYGVYRNYESDYKGDYSLLAGVEIDSRGVDDEALRDGGLTLVTIPSSRCLVFSTQGQMPIAVISAWTRIWEYFSREEGPRRAYTTDFERYDYSDPTNPRIDIHIAIRG